MGNIDLILGQNYASVYLLIGLKDLLEILQPDWEQ